MPNLIVSLPPSSDLESPAAWKKLANNRYSAQRLVVLMVKRRQDKSINGPELTTATYPAGSKYTLSTKKVVATKLTDSIQRTAERTISSKISTEFLARQTGGAGISSTGPSLTVGQETSEKIATELTAAAKEALSQTATFEIQNIEEIAKSIEINDNAASSGPPLALSLHLKLYVWHFDFYLVRIDELEIEYRKRLMGLISPVRRRIKSVSDPKALPLFRLKTYEPIEDMSVAKGEYRASVSLDEATAVHVEPLTDAAPSFVLAALVPLEESAKLAFPKTAEDRKKAKRESSVKNKAAKKASPKQRVPAKKVSRKKAAGR